MATATKNADTESIRALLLDPNRINDEELLKQWDDIWAHVNEMRVAINFARQSGKDVTIEMMYTYEQARNTERQYFWDNCSDQSVPD